MGVAGELIERSSREVYVEQIGAYVPGIEEPVVGCAEVEYVKIEVQMQHH